MNANTGERRQFVLLPARGLRARRTALASTSRSFFVSLHNHVASGTSFEAATNVEIEVIDSIREDGTKLVAMREDDAMALRANQPDIVVAPVLYYRLAVATRHACRAAPSSLSVNPIARPGIRTRGAAPPITVHVADRVTGTPIAGAQIVAFTDFANRLGRDSVTNRNGNAKLDFGTSPVRLERLYVYPPLAGYWGAFERDASIGVGHRIDLNPIDPSADDCLRHFHGAGSSGDGRGVVVGVIDTGAGPHPDLEIKGDSDNGEGHGSHVAGIIGGRGAHPNGVAGVAPGVSLRSYRVFGVPGGVAANYTIAKAIDQAVVHKCDLINLSLKIDNPDDPSGFGTDPVVQYALDDARSAGALPIAAAGNDNRTAVDFPARDTMSLAVSALGRIGTFPQGSLEIADIMAPQGDDPQNFIAAFSNVGPEVDLTGPGVGIVSTVPGGYGVMSGTSMACPAVSGMTARLLSNSPDILSMRRGPERSASIARLALGAARSLGFGAHYEGRGLIG